MAPFSKLCLVMALGASLAACNQKAIVACPSLVPYSADFQKALSREIAQLDAPYLFQVLNDYGVTRDAIRACLKRRAKK
jgi:hypothetical protein